MGAVWYLDFNSIKVQLELSLPLSIWQTATFQFHKGTIRTGLYYYDATVIYHFNSIKVQLEPYFA